MLDTDFGNQIIYNDLNPSLPTGNNVVELLIRGVPVDFADASTYYRVSTVNYLAAGACNFSDAGKTLWPLDQIVADTQYYVRDAVIEYVQDQTAPINPQIEGRLQFIADTAAPVITITSPVAKAYLHPDLLTIDFTVTDTPAGVKTVLAKLDGTPVTDGQVIDLHVLALGEHTFTVYAMDKAGNATSITVTFTVTATIQSLMTSVERFYADGQIDNRDVYKGLMDKLMAAYKSKKVSTTINILQAFINQVQAQSGKHITTNAAQLLLQDAAYVIEQLK
jgi:hypothetical protein